MGDEIVEGEILHNGHGEPRKLCPTGRGEYCDGCEYDEICNPSNVVSLIENIEDIN